MTYSVNFGTASSVIKNVLFLKEEGNSRLCLTLESIVALLQSSSFREKNKKLVPILKKAKEMMEKGKTGVVII